MIRGRIIKTEVERRTGRWDGVQTSAGFYGACKDSAKGTSSEAVPGLSSASDTVAMCVSRKLAKLGFLI